MGWVVPVTFVHGDQPLVIAARPVFSPWKGRIPGSRDDHCIASRGCGKEPLCSHGELSCRCIVLVAQPIDRVSQIGETPAGATHGDDVPKGVSGHRDGFVQPPDLGQHRPETGGVQRVVPRVALGVSVGNRCPGGLLGQPPVAERQRYPRLVPGQIRGAPVRKPEDLVTAPAVVELTAGLRDGSTGRRAIPEVGVTDSFAR